MILILCVGFGLFSLLALIFLMEAAALIIIFPPFFLSFSLSLHCLYLLTATPILVHQTDNLFTVIRPCKTQLPYNVRKGADKKITHLN